MQSLFPDCLHGILSPHGFDICIFICQDAPAIKLVQHLVLVVYRDLFWLMYETNCEATVLVDALASYI